MSKTFPSHSLATSSCIFSIASLAISEKFGFFLGENALPGDVICLDGDLGAGKTTLTQAIARGLQVPAETPVTSPSFALFQQYSGRIPLYHFDFYRLSGADDVIALGLDEFFYLSGCAVIEWSERAREVLPEERLQLVLTVDGEQSRLVHCTYTHACWQQRISRWRQLLDGRLY